jgi:DNA repair exonuclease SbcCD nuclease subunit
LGHIHAAEIVSRDPWIVFPGNLQGRSVREIGAKGAVRVTVDNGNIVDVTPLALDGARWAHLTIDVTNAANEAQVIAHIAAELTDVHAQSQGRPLAVRVTLTGATALHNHLVARRDVLQDDVRASGFQLADCWVEQVKVKTSLLDRRTQVLSASESLDVGDLLREAARDPEFTEVLAELTDAVRAKLPRELQEEFSDSDTLRSLADDARAMLAGEMS